MSNLVYKCRICSAKLDNRIVHLEEMPLTDDFVRDAGNKEYISDINIYQCRQCGVVQNPADFDYGGYYSDYQYTSGHSEFVKKFMDAYARDACSKYYEINGKIPESILEIGSGDGEQLKKFANLGASRLLGVEPSKYLADIANENGIRTEVALFDKELAVKIGEKYDICISSYTFDHVRDPIDYIDAAWHALSNNGLLVLEIHNLEKIVDRGEYCLFEHEHTIYLDAKSACHIINLSGFEVVSVNPLPDDLTRANSLIILARKNSHSNFEKKSYARLKDEQIAYDNIAEKINSVVYNLDKWIERLPGDKKLIGYGAGGRGVMTLAAIRNHTKFSCLYDANHGGHKFLTPKTRIPVLALEDLRRHKDAYVLIFSFGYFNEIKSALLAADYSKENIYSLLDFYI